MNSLKNVSEIAFAWVANLMKMALDPKKIEATSNTAMPSDRCVVGGRGDTQLEASLGLRSEPNGYLGFYKGSWAARFGACAA